MGMRQRVKWAPAGSKRSWRAAARAGGLECEEGLPAEVVEAAAKAVDDLVGGLWVELEGSRSRGDGARQDQEHLFPGLRLGAGNPADNGLGGSGNGKERLGEKSGEAETDGGFHCGKRGKLRRG